MKCSKCEYDTDTDIPKESTVTEKLTLLGFHREDDHPLVVPTSAVGEPATGDKRNKFLQPEIDQVQTLEV